MCIRDRVCIIAPVSSWAVAVGGYMGEDGFNTFVASIPYNFYALLTIFFVFFMLFLQKDFGPMAAAEDASNGRIPAEGSALEAVSLARIADKAQVDLEGAPNIPTVVTLSLIHISLGETFSPPATFRFLRNCRW